MKSSQSLPPNHEVSHFIPWNSWFTQGLIAREPRYVILNFIFFFKYFLVIFKNTNLFKESNMNHKFRLILHELVTFHLWTTQNILLLYNKYIKELQICSKKIIHFKNNYSSAAYNDERATELYIGMTMGRVFSSTRLALSLMDEVQF